MAETTNYHLHLTDSSSERFLDWRNAMNGTTNSNMVKIDTALGAKADASVSIDATLEAADWVDVDGVYEQDIAVTGLTATQNGNIGLSQSATATEREAACDAMLIIGGQKDGYLTIVVSGDCPSIDIPVTITLLG